MSSPGEAAPSARPEALGQLSAKGDRLERWSAVVGLKRFHGDLQDAVRHSGRVKGDRRAVDHRTHVT